MKEKAKVEEEKKDEEKEDPKGIPEFWLTVFKNVDLLSDMLQVRPVGREQTVAVVESRSGLGYLQLTFERCDITATYWLGIAFTQKPQFIQRRVPVIYRCLHILYVIIVPVYVN